jgi:hypothetical protein
VKGSRSGDFTVIPQPKEKNSEAALNDVSPVISYGLIPTKSPMDNNSRNKSKGIGSSGATNKCTLLTERTQK